MVTGSSPLAKDFTRPIGARVGNSTAIDRSEARLLQLHDALWRAYRIGIDADVHDRAVTRRLRRLQEGFDSPKPQACGHVRAASAHDDAVLPPRELLRIFSAQR